MADLPLVRLVAKHLAAEGTMAFEFEKPQGFTHLAGQFADFTLVDPPETDTEGNTRAFSLASAPFEPHLMICTRLRDTAFKRVLRDLPLGSEVVLDGPYGSFTLHHNTTRPAVFLTGGIGVTPVRSIVRDAARQHAGHPITVFYANNRTQDAAFLDDLSEAARKDADIRLVGVIAKPDESNPPWDGETGFIDAALLRRHLADLQGPIYYLCGPAGMVKAMRNILTEASVDPDDIRTEEFSGY